MRRSRAHDREPEGAGETGRKSQTKWIVASVLVPVLVAAIPVFGPDVVEWLRSAGSPTATTAAPATDGTPTPNLIIDSFEYASDSALQSAYWTNTAPGNEISLSLSNTAAKGHTSVAVQYAIQSE